MAKDFTCKRCHYQWDGRKQGRPTRCARCGDPHWFMGYIQGARPDQQTAPWRKLKRGVA